jgi:hypothetical protein
MHYANSSSDLESKSVLTKAFWVFACVVWLSTIVLFWWRVYEAKTPAEAFQAIGYLSGTSIAGLSIGFIRNRLS